MNAAAPRDFVGMAREPQYDPCFAEAPVTLGPMTGATFRWNPRRLGMMLARYKFVAKMVEGANKVAEIGCGDAFGSAVAREAVTHLHLYDFDDAWRETAKQVAPFTVHDIVADGRLYPNYDAIYALDVLEHIRLADEERAMRNICDSLTDTGTFIAGCPSLESQMYASDISKAGHVNCRTGADLRNAMARYFESVFLFGMNDEVLHTGFAPMCHYLFVLCSHPRYRRVPRPGSPVDAG